MVDVYCLLIEYSDVQMYFRKKIFLFLLVYKDVEMGKKIVELIFYKIDIRESLGFFYYCVLRFQSFRDLVYSVL